jgi:hypothetical protein
MTKRWQDWMTLILGVWLFFSPWVLGYAGLPSAVWNAYIIGLAITVVALVALYMPQAWQEWAGLVLGVWLIISPWVLGFSGFPVPFWNMFLVGLVVAVLDGWAIVEEQRGGARTA